MRNLNTAKNLNNLLSNSYDFLRVVLIGLFSFAVLPCLMGHLYLLSYYYIIPRLLFNSINIIMTLGVLIYGFIRKRLSWSIITIFSIYIALFFALILIGINSPGCI